MHTITIIKKYEDNTFSTHMIEDFEDITEFKKFTSLYNNFEKVNYEFVLLKNKLKEVRITIDSETQPQYEPVNLYDMREFGFSSYVERRTGNFINRSYIVKYKK